MRSSVLGCGVIGAALGFGCGGDTSAPRPEPNYCRPLVPVLDTPDDFESRASLVDCGALDGYELYPIQDFESGTARQGWYTNNDRTALQEPAPDSDPPTPSPIPGGRCLGVERGDNAARACDSPTAPRGTCTGEVKLESRSAMHIRSGLLTNNGGVFGRTFNKTCLPLEESPACNQLPAPPEVGPCSVGNGPSKPRRGCRAVDDMSNWDGIVFWGRVAPGSMPAIRLRVSDERTDDKACICQSYTNQNDSSTGCDKFGEFVVLDHDFRAYFVPFSEMQQGGWGMKAPYLDRSNLFEMAFEYGRGAWDLWIDDIAFYRRAQ